MQECLLVSRGPCSSRFDLSYTNDPNYTNLAAMTITSTQFIKTPGACQDEAQREPLVITKHDHEHAVLLSARAYQRLKRRDRLVFRAGELANRDVAAIAAATAPAEAAAFNDEVEDNRA